MKASLIRIEINSKTTSGPGSEKNITCFASQSQLCVIHFRCKICHKVILFESDTIQRHLSKSHKTNLGLYRLEYLNRMQQQQQQQPLQMTTGPSTAVLQ